MESDVTTVDHDEERSVILPRGLMMLAAHNFARLRALLANSLSDSEFADVLTRTTLCAPSLRHIMSSPHHRAVCFVLPAHAGLAYVLAQAFGSQPEENRPTANDRNIPIWRDLTVHGTEVWRLTTHPLPVVPTFSDELLGPFRRAPPRSPALCSAATLTDTFPDLWDPAKFPELSKCASARFTVILQLRRRATGDDGPGHRVRFRMVRQEHPRLTMRRHRSSRPHAPAFGSSGHHLRTSCDLACVADDQAPLPPDRPPIICLHSSLEC
jgi:hypothetical protein